MKTIIVIPVFQAMNSLEKISLKQAIRIFREEPICFVAPMSFDASEVSTYGNYKIERFDDGYFENTGTYSGLLLDARFYERFSAYDYLLVYQLDAFVFCDELPYFCSLGYDYFGAPWPLTEIDRQTTGNPVGNGGLSLRHVRHTISLLRSCRKIIERDWLPDQLGEDAFFGWAGMQSELGYKTAPLDVARRFSLECDVQHVFCRLSEETLPFGIHKWYQRDLQTWRPYIERRGYRIDPSDSHIRWTTSWDDRMDRMKTWAMRQRVAKRGNPQRMQTVLQSIFPMNRPLYLRGRGEVSNRIQSFLKRAQFQWAGVLDRGMIVPDADAFFLIASTRYENEIQEELMAMGRVPGRDFLTVREFEDRFLQKYYART
jgi:hypothetical protein